MRLPLVKGTIDRRMLINYRVDPDALAPFLPHPFRPKMHGGHGVAGICLIRLKAIRPRGLPPWMGLGSENAAHRVAVEWGGSGQTHEGVYITLRDTSARVNTLAGGRLFPGIHHHARFHVQERDEQYALQMQSDDGTANLDVCCRRARALPSGSIFNSIEDASDFFERGCVGYSPCRYDGQYDGIELHTLNWHVEPLAIERADSHFFGNGSAFPAGAAEVDHGLLMKQIDHEWHDHGVLTATTSAATADSAVDANDQTETPTRETP